ncbi:C4-dicarboxylate ABC transporter permease [Terasakiispira papahanaumokuakeensis]|uniref:TRAP transporter large permease protein n=1 Tax=Terasakiispira papahanaumokuakeensis TaxID=197479 RepID=A0A1E2V6V7_9GAMM|nr:TRAP transporter large permease [Terasakiispira papahanaumokuakeensis]ODC02740.1 C4-dicarboxylate ABC transporter permease [Terasakiispira papahanaumokuakeensis]
MGLTILFGVFFLGLVIGAPVAFAVGLAALFTFMYEGLPLFVAFQRMLSGISVFSLLAIPFFIFAGELMLHGGISARLVRFASAAVGRIRGGLGLVNVSSSMLFGGISGSAVADTSALGSILIPAMKEKGYDADYAVNVTVTSSIAGVVIPPSHNMILYAVAAGGGISVTQLFLAGLVPGVMMCLALAIAAYWVAVKRGYGAESFPGWQSLVISLAVSLPGLMTAVIIVGGVLSGILTVTESGAFGALYALVVTALVYRELSWSTFKQAVAQAVKTTSLVMILVGCASAFSYLLALYDVPSLVVEALTAISENPYVIFLMLNLVLLVLGMIMDMAALILICTPIFLPIAMQFGMSPVHFGIVLMMNLGIGLCTPPVGSCLFVGCVIGKIKLEQAVKTIWPFYLALFIALMLVTYVPFLSMALPNELGGS